MAAERGKAPPTGVPVGGKGAWQKSLIGFLISVICLGFIAWRIDLDEFSSAIANFDNAWLLFGILSLVLGYTVRVSRWSILLRAAGADVGFARCAAPFLGSIALNNILPMRLGDLVRAFVFPSAIGVGRIPAAASLVMERLVDLLTLLVCLLIGLMATSGAQLPEWLLRSAWAFSITGGLTLLLVFFFSGSLSGWVGRQTGAQTSLKRERVLHSIRDLLTGFDSMSRLPVLLVLFLLSMLVWAGEAGLFWSLLMGFGLDASLGGAILVMAIATLSTLVPSSPGYVGPFHLAAFSAISLLGGTPGQAASFAVLAHLAVWLPTTVAGALAILFNPQLFGRAKAMAKQAS